MFETHKKKYSLVFLELWIQKMATKRTSLSSNFTYWPSRPPRASFDDDRDLEICGQHVDNKILLEAKEIDLLNEWEDIEDCDEDIEFEQRWFAFEVQNCPPSLKFLVRFYR